jgi:hypothetical protein
VKRDLTAGRMMAAWRSLPTLLEDLDSNGTFAENASEVLGDAIRFGSGQLNGAAVAVHEETEEFMCRNMAIATSSTWRRNRASAGRVP